MEALDAGLHVEEPVGADLISCVEEVPAEEPQQCDKENHCIAEVDEQSLNQIKLQCEFYFSDANILKDQFMLNQVKSSKDGWVNLGIIEKFKKVQKLTKSHDVIIRALANSEKLEVSEDGLMIRRRCPLPEWDPSVYYRSLIVSDLPDGTKLDHSDLTEIFTIEESHPLLVRIFAPGRKVPSDLKRSQVLHPQLGTKFSAVVEFSSRPLAFKAVALARQLWPNAYVRLLSYGSKKFNEQNAKKEGKGSTKSSDEVPTDRRPFSLHLKSPTESITVVHIREPIAPPKEDSVGFTAGWRDVLRLARMSLFNGCAAASPTELTQQPPIPDDNAIVSVIPYASPAVDALPATS